MSCVLIVDDEIDFASLLVTVLEQAGYQVVRADSGRTALKQLVAQPFDLLVVDNWMPDMGGLEFLRRLRSTGDHTPAIVMTAYAEIDDVVESLHLEVKDFLVKPFELTTTFLSTVDRCMAKSYPPQPIHR